MTLLERLDGPSVAPISHILRLPTFRAAVVTAWKHRKFLNMTKTSLCERTGMRPSHVTEYLADHEFDEKGRELREMPAKYLPKFEEAIGNSFASQWLAVQSKLTILESQIAEQKASMWQK